MASGPSRDHGFISMTTIVWPLLIYWLVLFVVCFVLVEIGHDQLYDEVAKHAGLRVAGGSFVLAASADWPSRLRLSGFVRVRCSPPTSAGRCFKAWSGSSSSCSFFNFIRGMPWARCRRDAAGFGAGHDGCR